MARKKTRKEKLKTDHRRKAMVKSSTRREGGVIYSLDDIGGTKTKRKKKRKAEKKHQETSMGKNDESLFDYDPALLKKDMIKTMIISMVMFGILGGLWVYLK